MSVLAILKRLEKSAFQTDRDPHRNKSVSIDSHDVVIIVRYSFSLAFAVSNHYALAFHNLLV